MGRYNDWTMVHEKNSLRCHFQFIISQSNLSGTVKNCPSSPNFSSGPTRKSIRLWKCVHEFKDETSKHQSTGCEMCGPTESAGAEVNHVYVFLSHLTASYRGAQQFHRPSSAQSSHNSELQRRCPRPIYFLWGEDRQEHAQKIFMSTESKWHTMIPHISCVTIFHYCYIEGERWRPKSCSATVHPSINRRRRKKKKLRSKWLTATK